MEYFWLLNENMFLKFMPPLKQKLYKLVSEILEENKITRVLDFGCGNGNQLEFLKGSLEIGLYDKNKTIAANTFSRFAGNKNVFLIEDIIAAEENFFDAIVINMVWMCLNGENEVDDFFSQIKKVKKKDGLIILTMTHPCFRDELFSYYHTSYSTSEKIFDYILEGNPFEVIIKNNPPTIFTDYHYSLNFFFKKLKQHELQLIDFYEISDEEHDLIINKRFTPYLLTTIKSNK